MKARAHRPTDPNWQGGEERLQKILARAGFGSRRACEDLVTEGRVSVNAERRTDLGARANPAIDDIRVDNEAITFPDPVLYMLYKPRDVLCTNSDDKGRDDKLAINLVPQPKHGRLFTVGRLDKDSEGLLLITNDGELCEKLTHPRHEVPKLYHVTVRGYLKPETQRQMVEGIWLSDGRHRPDRVYVRKRTRKSTMVEVVLSEGRNREIRRIFAKVGHPVSRLVRMALGPLDIRGLRPGEHVRLEDGQIDALLNAADEYRKGKIKKRKEQERAKLAKTAEDGAPMPEDQPNTAAAAEGSGKQKGDRKTHVAGGKKQRELKRDERGLTHGMRRMRRRKNDDEVIG